MSDERAMKAIRRIEQAIGRIEAATDRPAAPPPARTDDGELIRLKEAHQALRRKVESAIGDIDRLLDEEPR